MINQYQSPALTTGSYVGQSHQNDQIGALISRPAWAVRSDELLCQMLSGQKAKCSAATVTACSIVVGGGRDAEPYFGESGADDDGPNRFFQEWRTADSSAVSLVEQFCAAARGLFAAQNI